MPFCQNCGKQLPDQAAFCPSCGKPTNRTAPTIESASAVPSGSQAEFATLLEANDVVMEKKILSLREHYDFQDRSGNKLGEGDGNFFQLPAKFKVLDANGSQVMGVEGKILSLRHEFTIHDSSGAVLAAIRKKIVKLIGEEYWLERNGDEFMRIYGNFTEHDYRMEVSGTPVASVHKKWVSIRDQFGISITREVDHRLVIGSVIVIEHIEVTEKQNNKNRSGISVKF